MHLGIFSRAAALSAFWLLGAGALAPAALAEEALVPPASQCSPLQPLIRNIWLEKHVDYNRAARKGGIDLLFLGDSITEGWRYRGEAPKVWAQYYGPRRAANFGIGGDRVEHLLWRVENTQWENLSPKLVVILIGTNNVAHHEPAEIAQGILKLTQTVRERLPRSKILLLGIFPRGERPDDPLRKKVEAVNALLGKAVLPANTLYLDIGDKFLTPQGGLPKEYFYDGLHPTRKGHEIWAENIEPFVRAALEAPQAP